MLVHVFIEIKQGKIYHESQSDLYIRVIADYH